MDYPSTQASTASLRSPELSDVELFLDRELSWLHFNKRVLHEAVDDRTPLLERLKFLSIVTSNLDEFFMKRVGRLRRRHEHLRRLRKAKASLVEAQLAAIKRESANLLDVQALCYKSALLPALWQHGIELASWNDLSSEEQEASGEFFHNEVLPLLTPLTLDAGHPFPFLPGLATCFAFLLSRSDKENDSLSVLEIPRAVPQWIPVALSSLEKRRFRFISLKEVLFQCLGQVFQGMSVRDAMVFRITRDAEITLDEEDCEDLLGHIEEELKERNFGKVVRFEHQAQPNQRILSSLMKSLQIGSDQLYEIAGELDYTAFEPIWKLDLPQYHFEQWCPVVPGWAKKKQKDIFSIIRRKDVLVHHPYDSFSDTVERFVQEATEDPQVLSIKMTLYRTGDASPFIPLLVRAAEQGKQVACLVELKARFDEQRNIRWAQVLEDAGVNVIYGMHGLKTHSKTILVVRRENEGLRSYAHIATGNYHAETACLYTDVGLFTCDAEITDDLVTFFNYLTASTTSPSFSRIMVAPFNMKKKFLKLISREIEHAQKGEHAQIIAKMNSLEDRDLCCALYEASRAGVSIDLIVRGFCVLRPGIRGLSENIRVISVIGRLLEHSRIFYFRAGAESPELGEFYIGSADWMKRNLERRVEVVTPLDRKKLKSQCWEALQVILSDYRQVWEMRADGLYTQRMPHVLRRSSGTHKTLMDLTALREAFAVDEPDCEDMLVA